MNKCFQFNLGNVRKLGWALGKKLDWANFTEKISNKRQTPPKKASSPYHSNGLIKSRAIAICY